MTDDAGNVVERRYLGEDRFVLLVGRYLHGTGETDHTDSAHLIPRTLFFQSELYHRLNGADGRWHGPLVNATTAAWRDEARANADDVHLAVNAGWLQDEDGVPLGAMPLAPGRGDRFGASVQERRLK